MGERRRVTALLIGIAITVAACGADGTAQDGSATAEAAGDALPGLAVDAFSGETVALTDWVGRPLVVNFWASWCGPCVAEMPDLEAVHQVAGDQVTFIGINTQDTPDAAADLVEQTGVTYELVRDPDGELFQAFDVFGMPSTFYVNPEGRIVARHTGLLTRDALLADLDEHLGVDL